MQFPSVTGSNLQRRKLDLPEGFEGELNLVLIAFQQWQQSQVDTWIPFARPCRNQLPRRCIPCCRSGIRVWASHEVSSPFRA